MGQSLSNPSSQFLSGLSLSLNLGFGLELPFDPYNSLSQANDLLNLSQRILQIKDKGVSTRI
jgi:hypothetical protein